MERGGGSKSRYGVMVYPTLTTRTIADNWHDRQCDC
jgi:hypothetical protein